jgi:hypothetical protein
LYFDLPVPAFLKPLIFHLSNASGVLPSRPARIKQGCAKIAVETPFKGLAGFSFSPELAGKTLLVAAMLLSTPR